jgi:hypothetical protein
MMKRTTLELTDAAYAATKAEADKDRRPWTKQLAVLIDEALAARARKAPRTAMPSE